MEKKKTISRWLRPNSEGMALLNENFLTNFNGSDSRKVGATALNTFFEGSSLPVQAKVVISSKVQTTNLHHQQVQGFPDHDFVTIICSQNILGQGAKEDPDEQEGESESQMVPKTL